MSFLKTQHPEPWRVEKGLGKQNIIPLLYLWGDSRPIRAPTFEILSGWCLWAPPPRPECHHQSDNAKGSAGRGRERERVKRGNFWNDGCWRWCPICFSSLEFTASAALCKQLGSKTGCSAISSSPFLFFSPPFFFFYARSAMSLRQHNFRFLWRNT